MNKRTKGFLILAACLIASGTALAGVAFLWKGADLFMIGREAYTEKRTEIKTDFSDLVIRMTDCDVTILPSENASCVLVSDDSEKIFTEAEVKDGTLTVTREDKREWYERIFSFGANPDMTLYLPQNEYGKLFVKTASGDVETGETLSFSEVTILTVSGDVVNRSNSAGDTTVMTTSGDMKVSGTSGGKCTVQTTSGEIWVKGEADSLYLSTTSGGVLLPLFYAKNECVMKTTSGDIRAFGRSGDLTVEAVSGEVKLQQFISSGKMEIETVSGDVTLSQADAQSLRIRTTSGDVHCAVLSAKNVKPKTSSGNILGINGSSEQAGDCEIKTTSGNIYFSVVAG